MIEVFNKRDLDTELSKCNRVLALFYSSGCPFCKRFVIFFDREASVSGIGRIIHVRLDDYSNRLWDDYAVPAVPTVILFEDGKVSKRLNARLGRGLTAEEFMIWLKDNEKLK